MIKFLQNRVALLLGAMLFVGGLKAQLQVVTINASSPTTCDGIAYFSDSTQVNATTVLWQGGGAVIQQGGASAFNLCPGTYTVTYTVGLGVAFSFSYLVGLLVTLGLLKKHTGKLAVREFLAQHMRLLTAALLVMLPLFAMVEYIAWVGAELSQAARAGELLLVMVIAFFGYIFAAKALKVEEISMIRRLGSSISRRSTKTEENH